MSIHAHALTGCAPVPLAHYLKAFGILRLVSEQADPSARGCWRGEQFLLLTRLSRAELQAFFLQRYRPTPLVSPWNKGSGFYDPKDAGLNPIRQSTCERLQPYRDAIQAVDQRLNDMQEADAAVRRIKEESNRLPAAQREALRKDPVYKARLAAADAAFKQLKDDVIPDCRRRWRGQSLEWLEAAIVLTAEGETKCPSLLGTGGNDGRLDFTNNFMKRLQDLFDLGTGLATASSAALLDASLYGAATAGYDTAAPIGQFLPGGAGGMNMGSGPDGRSVVNPWDYVLLFEGALLFRSSAPRGLGAGSSAPAPFAQPAQAAAFATASGQEKTTRGEQWMPLFANPLSLTELTQLLSEGRMQIGRRAAETPLDAARALQRLGATRGIRAFQRYGYIERNGLSNFAVPLGRFEVSERPAPHIGLFDDVASWLERLARAGRDAHAPASLQERIRQLQDAAFAAASRPDVPRHWAELLEAMARVESLQCRGSGFAVGPIPTLQAAWVRAADDGSAEFRLALALASQAAAFSDKEPLRLSGPIRRHFLPLDGVRFAVVGAVPKQQLAKRPDVVVQDRDALADCIALLDRRLIERTMSLPREPADKGPPPKPKGLPLTAPGALCAHPADLSRWLDGHVDAERCLRLARALTAVGAYAKSRGEAVRIPATAPPADTDALPPEAWMVLRLAYSPDPLPWVDRLPALDPALLRRLASGDVEAAYQIAVRKLLAIGVRPTLRNVWQPPEVARRWAAALALPVSPATVRQFLRAVDPALQNARAA